MVNLFFCWVLTSVSVLAPSCSAEYPPERRHAWHPGSRLPVLPAGTLQGPDVHLQGLPVLTPAGPGNHREEIRPQQHASGQSQGEKEKTFSSWRYQRIFDHQVHWEAAVPTLLCLSCQGEVLFDSWMSIFSGNGGLFNPTTPVYSFDGRDVLTDNAWWDTGAEPKHLSFFCCCVHELMKYCTSKHAKLTKPPSVRQGRQPDQYDLKVCVGFYYC